MNNMVRSLRFLLSVLVYATSIGVGILAAKIIITSITVMISAYATPQEIGGATFNLITSVLAVAIAYGLWLFGRYVRTSSFKKQPRTVVTKQP
ncbi:hypothetical protein ACVWZ9_004047 [Pseudomonas chlororaphis]